MSAALARHVGYRGSPIARPTWAAFSAGASLTPSPVIADDFSAGLERFHQRQFLLRHGHARKSERFSGRFAQHFRTHLRDFTAGQDSAFDRNSGVRGQSRGLSRDNRR